MPPKLVENPTYILAPNWTFVPGGPIALGNVIADPSRPHIVLKKPPKNPATQPSVQQVSEKNWRLHLSSQLNLSASLWAQFVELVGLKLGASHGRHARASYSMRELETVYYVEMPDSAFVKELIKDPAVHELMRLDNPFSRPVYMVTGLKISRGFVLSVDKSGDNSGGLGASGPAGPATAGGGVDISVKSEKGLGFESGNDIIFAYQLVRIAPKGWKEKTFKLREYAPSAAFLSDGDDKDEQEMEVESDFLEMQDLEDPGMGFSSTKVLNGSMEYSCIAFEDE
ncbi:hypothetical protein DL766_000357 [Monosporascus sp. MC13-8B]|uniref:Uncharacterized protein n=1 Tax=Monosporascus cannonballus TaxID=155416 RepID=A0ABY0HK48_9PEZI|nr:hypothetical protein DL762_001667 [Monosporascus cannonballus]RYO99983.1 hypothetical protein DL763_001114 [Monosporascus cannonballus]RYP39535.1 hypothetical protein DL766_000357 [Monosporascus sp. MC13-8B]